MKNVHGTSCCSGSLPTFVITAVIAPAHAAMPSTPAAHLKLRVGATTPALLPPNVPPCTDESSGGGSMSGDNANAAGGGVITTAGCGGAAAVSGFSGSWAAIWLLSLPSGSSGVGVPSGRCIADADGRGTAVADGRYHRRVPTVGTAELADLSSGVELMRTRLVAALSERERAQDNLRSLFNLAPDAMLSVARDGSIIMANAQAVQLYGYTAHELVGAQADILVPEEWRAGLRADTTSYFGDRRSHSQWERLPPRVA